MNKNDLILFAKVAAATYEDYPWLLQFSWGKLGFKCESSYDYNGAQAFVLSNDKYYIMAFRGTELSEGSDIVADLKIRKSSAEVGGRVHSGFRSELNKIWDTMYSDLAGNVAKKQKQIVLIGHSLGAGMATIAASRLLPYHHNHITLITFGSPRVGNKKFVKFFENWNDKFTHWRVQNCNDIVTKLPPYSMGYRHCGNHFYLDYNGEVKSYGFWQVIKDNIRARFRAKEKGQFFSGLYDHTMKSYIKKLSN